MGEVGANFILHPLNHTLPSADLTQDIVVCSQGQESESITTPKRGGMRVTLKGSLPFP
jgi:hypothetical protein